MSYVLFQANELTPGTVAQTPPITIAIFHSCKPIKCLQVGGMDEWMAKLSSC
jgi:hypothetical protein